MSNAQDKIPPDEREEVRWKNEAELLRLMSEHGLDIPARDLAKWRPTVPTSGTIPGVAQNVQCIATDGLLGWFLYEFEKRPPLKGHVTSFVWDTPIENMVPYYDTVERRMKYFKQVRDRGTPPTKYAVQKARRENEITDYERRKAEEKKKRKRPTMLDRALKALSEMKPKK